MLGVAFSLAIVQGVLVNRRLTGYAAFLDPDAQSRKRAQADYVEKCVSGISLDVNPAFLVPAIGKSRMELLILIYPMVLTYRPDLGFQTGITLRVPEAQNYP